MSTELAHMVEAARADAQNAQGAQAAPAHAHPAGHGGAHPAGHGGAHPGSAAGRGMRPGGGAAAAAFKERTGVQAPRIIAWEITRSCNLSCAHCRAAAEFGAYPGELTLDQAKALVDDIASITNPILILTGGEPFMRPDIWQIIDYARSAGCMPVIGTNGTVVTEDIARKMAEHGITRMSVSLDFPDAARHDAFRGQDGSFEDALRGIRLAQQHGVGVQVNTTVTKQNAHALQEMHDLAQQAGAVAFHPFLLVPTGRGESLRDVELSPEEYEEVLTWAYYRQQTSPLHFKPTDSPQYYRISHQLAREPQPADGPGGTPAASEGCSPRRAERERGLFEPRSGEFRSCSARSGERLARSATDMPPGPSAEDASSRAHGAAGHSGASPFDSHTRGCLGGITFCFISHVGDVQPCGYFDMQLGNVKERPFSEIWETSPVFQDLRDYSRLKGKCGACEYKGLCGGCRARALAATGDYLDEEPYCAYVPRAWRTAAEDAGA